MSAEKQHAGSSRKPRLEPLTRLATGGMADIWLARELGAAGLERFVVIKRLLPHLARDPDIVDMFVSEARFVARLVHPNVVQIHELAEDEEGYFLVMEYVAGCSVRELLAAARRAERILPPDVAVCIVEQACRGAHAAHELTDAAGRPLGLVHRDISPHNLMVGPHGDVKLLDFGIAKATQAAEATRTGSLKGKQGYMSPEQCRVARVDRRSDVFALGIVCWELLTCQRLFKRETEYETMRAIAHGEAPLLSEVRPDLPPAFDAVVARALAADPEARWQTADDFRRVLIAAADESEVPFSRDMLADHLIDLLGDKLAQREQALRGAASLSAHPDPSALQEVLARSETSMKAPADLTARTHSDEIATVVQRRSGRPGAPEPGEPSDAGASAPPAGPWSEAGGDEEATHLDQRGTGSAPLPLVKEERSTPPSAPAPRHRWLPYGFAVALLVAAVVAWWGLLREPGAAGSAVAPPPGSSAPTASVSVAPPTGPPLRFVVAPTVKPEVMRRELAPFLAWLGRAVDRPVELIIADSYRNTAELVTSGRGHFGLFPPLLFVSTMATAPALQPLAVRLYDGARASDGYLLVRGDGGLATAADLRGKTICHVDRTSTTGFLLPRIWLRDQGLDPDEDLQVVISGNHLAAIRDLASGKCDAASVYSGAYLSAREEGIAVGKLRLFAVTGRVPQDTLAASPELPDDVVARLRKALLGFDPERDIDAGQVGEVLGISGFAPFDPTEFDKIRAAAEQEGIVAAADAGR